MVLPIDLQRPLVVLFNTCGHSGKEPQVKYNTRRYPQPPAFSRKSEPHIGVYHLYPNSAPFFRVYTAVLNSFVQFLVTKTIRNGTRSITQNAWRTRKMARLGNI